MWRQGRTALAAALVAAVLGGCGAAVRGGSGGSGPDNGGSVEVENNKWMDVVVYAVRSGRKERLGMVTSTTTRQFDLPSWAVTGSGDLALLIDPIGSDGMYYTGPIPVSAGDRVSLRVENHMPLSSFFIRGR